MRTLPQRHPLGLAAALLIFAIAPLENLMAQDSVTPTATASTSASDSEHNKSLIRDAFDRWRNGQGSVFDLLAPEAHWTIAGTSLAAGEYRSREEFLAKVIVPFNARVSRPLSPTVRQIHADGDNVVVLFDGETVANDGQPYVNTYAWFMRLENGKIVDATAFFDSKTFDVLWTRVQPSH